MDFTNLSTEKLESLAENFGLSEVIEEAMMEEVRQDKGTHIAAITVTDERIESTDHLPHVAILIEIGIDEVVFRSYRLGKIVHMEHIVLRCHHIKRVDSMLNTLQVDVTLARHIDQPQVIHLLHLS